MPKFVLSVIDIDGAQQFLTGFLTVHKLALWDGASIQYTISANLNIKEKIYTVYCWNRWQRERL